MLRIRDAVRADAGAIARLERESALVRDDGSRVTLLRGASLFDQLELMGDARLFVAEDDGAVVACDAASVHDVRVGAAARRLLYRHHVRVLPGHRRRGLNEAFSERVLDFARESRADGGYVYVDPHNALVREWQSSPSGAKTWRSAPAWSVAPVRALLRCDALAGPAAGRPASAADAARIAALANACHAGEEMFLPFDEARLSRRLGRLPAVYGWKDVWIGGDAAVGVWNAGERCLREAPEGAVSESTRAFVLDYGFAPQRGLADFERLLRAWCRPLAGEGATHLSIFTSPGSPGEALIRGLAESTAELRLQSSAAEPAGVAGRGVFVDHLYF